jgi:hypothetical protein
MGKKVNKRELAELLGYSETALTDMQGEDPPLPIQHKGERGEENAYDSAEAIAWLMQRAVRKASGAETQRDRLTRLQADAIERDNRIKEGELVLVGEIEPTHRNLSLALAAYLTNRKSRFAGELVIVAPQGIEAIRKVVGEGDAEILTAFGTDGMRMLEEIDRLLAKLSSDEADAFLKRIAGPAAKPGPGGDVDQGAAGSGTGEAGPTV